LKSKDKTLRLKQPTGWFPAGQPPTSDRASESATLTGLTTGKVPALVRNYRAKTVTWLACVKVSSRSAVAAVALVPPMKKWREIFTTGGSPWMLSSTPSSWVLAESTSLGLTDGASDLIASLRYFEALIQEVQQRPFPPGYGDHLRFELKKISHLWNQQTDTHPGRPADKASPTIPP
jgi:hypothetical protein